MGRTEKTCIGDCACCPLLAEGEVEMVPCILDQIFKRQQLQGEALRRLSEMVKQSAAAASSPKLAATVDE